MTRSRSFFSSAIPLTAIAVPLLVGAVAGDALAAIRPIQDFVSTQGTYCFDPEPDGICNLFVPPVANFIGWTVTGDTKVASVDYAGLANGTFNCGTSAFRTTTEGSVIERPLSDGRAEVTVVLHTRNALTWVADGDFASGPLLFGSRVCEAIASGNTSLGDSLLQVVFLNTAPGAPLPDVIRFLLGTTDAGQELISLSFRSQADGILRVGFGVGDGTRGRATVVQTGTLFRTNFGGAAGDGFPAERIDLKVVGH